MSVVGAPVMGIELLRAAAAWHEILLAVVTTGPRAGDELATGLLTLHAPFNPPVAMQVGPLFRADDPRPVCRGCDRIQHTVSRDPTWPCSTYTILAQHLLNSQDAQRLREAFPALDTASPTTGGLPVRGRRANRRHP